MNPPTDSRIRTLTGVVARRQAGFVIVLEDIHDPHNCAAIMRTADSMGIKDIWFVFDREKPYDPRLIGKTSSSSANKWMDFRIFTSITDCTIAMKSDGYTVIATALDPAAEALPSADLTPRKIAVVFGNEHAGVSPAAIRLADRILYIPMDGFVQSLNVSVSAAIIMAEITRQRRATGNGYAYSERERQTILDDYLKR
jgi:tRNA (guanosine-2'-O-)-methyltransferase